MKKIKRIFHMSGYGLHTGELINISIEPNISGEGIKFYRTDLAVEIPLQSKYVVDTRMATVIGKNHNATVSTIEHLLATLNILRIKDVTIYVDGPEIPIMDGSAIEFAKRLIDIGLEDDIYPGKRLKILKDIEVSENDSFAKLRPLKEGEETSFETKIHFDSSNIKTQVATFSYDSLAYAEILSSRTFGFEKDFDYLRSQNLALGASLDNVVGISSEDIIMNPLGLRNRNEFANHKLLDAIGDLSLLGYEIEGKFKSYKGGHSLHDKLVKAVLSCEENYEIITCKT